MVQTIADPALVPYMARELSARWAVADRETRRRGRSWYPAARELMETLAADTGYTLEQAVAVLAITSPGAQLVTNLEWTRRALESRGTVRVGRFPNRQLPLVQAVLADPAAAMEYVRGPKVSAFHRAILGETSALVLDRWALHAAGYTSEGRDSTPGDRLREAIARAYAIAAKRARCALRDFQAVVWIHARETTPVLHRGKWIVRRLADITS